HWSIYFLLWWIPAFTYYSLIVRIRNIAEHSVTPGETNLNNTRTTKASFLTRYLLVPHHVNFHLEHHLFTNCPWYNLPKVHEMLKGEPLRDKMCIEKSYFSVLRKATSG
ncbi:MAG TPA: fatty acid desaturase, partial [Gammaproteobacteria bacterium]|nr:fatty acid desaturase [Gammaproteobacteria bacterium]HIB75018.1 fatty acid desaturase [Gammaproteobacteria bacterium]HIO04612.1 fatty acid desaturase [Gammaproteobacteria bacterium]